MVRTRRGLEKLGTILADFQQQALADLDEAVIALAAGQPAPCPRQLWVMTKGSSKTTLIAVDLLWLILFSRQPVEGRVGAGDLEQASEARKVIKDLIRDNPWLDAAVEVTATEIRSKRNDNRLVLETMARQTAHGGRPLVTWVDEFVHVPDGGGEEFVDALVANQTKLAGLLIISSNAGMLDSWQYRRHQEYTRSPLWKCFEYNRPAPWISEAEIRATGIPEMRIQRLYHGVWSALAEALARVDIDAAVTLPGPTQEHEGRGWRYFAGLDIGVRRDHTSLVLIGQRTKTKRLKLITVKDWEPPILGKVDLADVLQTTCDLCKRFSAVLYVDPSQAELLGQQLVKAGIQLELISFVGRNLNEMASNLIEVFTDHAIDLFNHPQLLDDLYRVQLADTPAGFKLVPARTRAGHGDRGVCLALAILATKRAEPRYTLDVYLGDDGSEKPKDASPGPAWSQVKDISNPAIWKPARG
jgi:hypothetical protein